MQMGEPTMADDLERRAKDAALEPVSMQEIEAEDATALPNKEVMSLLDVNANVDLGLDLAAPVDLAVAANLNVAAPIEAAAAANVLSSNAEAVGVAQQAGTIDQTISGSAEATAPQNAQIDQSDDGAGTPVAPGGETPAVPGGETPTLPGGETPTAPGDGGTGVDVGVPVPGDVTDPANDALDTLLQNGSLLDAEVNINADADITAPINGAVAANANVAAPINAAVGANIGSDGAVAQALADQQVNINQSLDDVSAEATAEQTAEIDQ
jgi:hypothetical protein